MIAPNKDLDPVEAATAPTSEQRLASPFRFSRPTDGKVQSARILIVDDDPAIGRAIQRNLQAAGFSNFDLLSDCQQAVSRAIDTAPDIVLLDVQMEPGNGLAILERLRADDRGQHIPVVMVTQSSDETTKLTAMNLGANDFLCKPVTSSELTARVRNTLSAKAYRDQVVDYTLQLESDVLSDALTGIPNRRAFDYELKRRISEWRRQKTPLGLMMVDIDHFKQFNDRYGHAVGDAALCHVTEVMTSILRDMDLVARYGGEEFAIILPSTDNHAAIKTCRHLQAAICAAGFEIDGQKIALTVSVGLANCMNGDDAELLMRRADMALYAAKQNGRNRSYQHNGASCIPLSEVNGRRRNARLIPRTTDMPESNVHSATIAIVDDEPTTIALAKKYLRDDGFNSFITINQSVEAMNVIRREEPDLVLLDLRMPEVGGLQILEHMRADPNLSMTPVLVLTATRDKDAKVEALELGANDFLGKPLHPKELLARVHNTLLVKAHVDMLADYSTRLEHEVQLRTAELTASRREAVQCLARAAELRDDVTGRHVLRVGHYAAIIAKEMGFSEERIAWMEHAAQLHDVGKIGIPDAILHKPGKLTEDEFRIMQGHCVAGHSIIRDEVIPNDTVKHRNVFDDWTSPMMAVASLVAATHHERWDGSGYPRGLKGTDIPIEGRITAVADVFDALSTKRPYKAAIPLNECFRIVGDKRGTHFDPDVLDAFFRRRSEIVQVAQDYADPTV